MSARRLPFILFAALVAVPRASSGQTPNERAVRAAVDSFFAAVSAEKWDSAATFLDLARFEPYFRQVVSNARTALPPPPLTVESLMASDSTMPRAVAEWQIGRMNNYPRPEFGDMSHEFAGVRTQRDLFALTVPEAAARWLEAKDERTSMRESFRRSGCALTDLPAFPPSKHTVIGVAVIDDSTVYAIQRDDRFRGEDLNAPQSERVIPVHRVRGRWLIEPRGDLLRPFNGGIWYGMSCPKNKR